MSFWLSVFSPETWGAFGAFGGHTAGFPRWAQRSAGRLRIGDTLLFYVTQHSCFVGAAVVSGAATLGGRQLFSDDYDRFVVRVPVTPLVTLAPQDGIPIREIWDSLIRTRSIKQGSVGWSYKARFKQALAPMEDLDGKFILRSLNQIVAAKSLHNGAIAESVVRRDPTT